MRTTLTLDDDLGAALKRLAHERDTSFKQIVNDTLRQGLGHVPPSRTPHRMKPARVLGSRPEYADLSLNALAGMLEDQDIVSAVRPRS